MASTTRLPAASADASEVGSWAMTLVSPRSTVTRLVAPRNVMAMTVPVSGPDPASDSGAFDASQIATWGKQIGARYVVTGKVFTSDERQDGERRVQYFMFIQVLEVETGQILFQHKSAVTKAII